MPARLDCLSRTKALKSDEFMQCARVVRIYYFLENTKHKETHSTAVKGPLLLCMHCCVCGKNVTHIQKVLTELCCIMLDNADHSVSWGRSLMV